MSNSSSRILLWILPAIVISLIAALGIGKWMADRKFERDCARVASWVKSGHPTPGSYPNLALPASLASLSADHAVDAVVLPDGRIVLVVKTSLSWHHNWSGIIYASGPITVGEMGTDPYGRPQIRINGLPLHFVEKQVDWRHFAVAFDLG